MIQTEQKKRLSAKIFNRRTIELILWVFGAFLYLLPAIRFYMNSDLSPAAGADLDLEINSTSDFYDKFNGLWIYNRLLFASVILVTPVLFELIFGMLPIECARNMINIRKNKVKEVGTEVIPVKQDEVKAPISPQIIDYAFACIKESSQISSRIFLRSGAYLLLGCLIAFAGIALFFSPVFATPKSTDVTQRLLDYLPRFGSLSFIEFIAFFFLRQYRIMLEEYRYYEAIKRERQDYYNLIQLVKQYKEDPAALELLAKYIPKPAINKLSNGETTELLETQKLVIQEFDIFSKITDLVKEIRLK